MRILSFKYNQIKIKLNLLVLITFDLYSKSIFFTKYICYLSDLKIIFFCNFPPKSYINHFMKALLTIGLLILSNTFMTLAWYGHLKFSELKWFHKLGLASIILISWGIAFFEYCFQVPANRVGFKGNGGPFSLVELKVLQEVITLVVFTVFTMLAFKNETFRLNHLIGFIFLVLAVYFIFKK